MDKNKILLISPDDVKAESQINYNVDDSVIAASIKTVQTTYFKELVGKKMYDFLIEKTEVAIQGGDPSELYEMIMEDYVIPYLAAKVNAEICVPISLKVRNIGVSQDSDTNIQAAQLQNINYLRSFYESLVCDRANAMSKYFRTNETIKKDFYSNCGCDADSLIGKKFANVNLFLG